MQVDANAGWWDSREPTGLEDALDYAGRGMHVFLCESINADGRCTCGAADCDSPGKHPAKTVAPRGFYDATTDPNIIKAWCERRPGANVAIRTGTESNLVVLDEDQPAGPETRAALEAQFGSLPDTARVLTGGGGMQYLFAHPGYPVPCSSGKLGPNLDVRADGGYIIAPRSLHQSGRIYTFEIGASLGDLPLAPAPDWFLERACGSAQPNHDESKAGEIPKGRRNATLTRIAGALRRQGCGFDEILAALHETNTRRCRPALADREVVAVARSVMRYAPEPSPEPPPAAHRFRFYTVPELLDLRQPEYDFEGLIQERTLAVLAGPPKCGKSFVGVHLACCKAHGLPFHGTRSVKQGSVVYVCAEGNRAKFGRRIAAFLHRRGLSAEGLPLWVLTQPVQLMQRGEVGELLTAIHDLPEPPQLVIFDTLARCAVGADENSQKDMGLIVAGADRVRTEIQATVVLIHHTRLDGMRERGSTALRGATDTLILVTKEDATITLVDASQKDDPEGEGAIRFSLHVVDFPDGKNTCVLVEADDERKTQAPDPLPKSRQHALDTLRTAFDADGATWNQWLETSGLTKPTFGRAVNDLVSWGLIRKAKQKYVVA